MRRKIFILALMALAIITISAKPFKTNQVYMFGFSASFKDSVIYVTDIQNVQGAWIDTKTKFLLDRDEYSMQMKSYTDSLGTQDRVSVIFYALKKKKAEKKYLKLMKKYKKGYDIRYVNANDFRFKPIDQSPQE